MQQRDDVWSRGYSECASWVPVVHIPPTDVTDSFRAPKRLKTPSGSHIHPNNTDYRLQTTDYQHSLLPAQYLPWYMKQDLPSLPPLLHIRVYPPISLDTVWWELMFQSTTGFHLLPSQSRLRSFTAWLLSMGSRPRWGLLDTRPETNERIKTQ